jgi:hypothetical protein
MSSKIDLHSSSREEYKQFYITTVKEDLSKYPDQLDAILDYLFDQAYLKGEVDQRQFIDKIRAKVSE